MNDLLKLAIEGHGGMAPGADLPVPRRRVYLRNPDGSPVRDLVPVAIDGTFS